MLTKTTVAFQERLDYSRKADGSWKAEFHGAVDVVTEGPTLERCRSRALDLLDEKLAAWIAGRAEICNAKPSGC